ncbi:MAG: hypothetical protein V1674_06585 [Candidatus Omnitrophota bacterium]
MTNLFKNKAQSLNEYAILIGILAAALLIMQAPVKRLIQGRLKDVSDNFRDYLFLAQSNSTYSSDMGSESAMNTVQGQYSLQRQTAGTTALTSDVRKDEKTHNEFSASHTYEKPPPD